jgi:hypothetical protein
MRGRGFCSVVVAITMLSLCAEPLAAFDTFWHSATTGAATREYKFSLDATNIVQFGNFSGPDFFGPLFDTALPKVGMGEAGMIQPATRHEILTFEQAQHNTNIRKAAIFMHFDNLHGQLNTNWKFNYLFMTLLRNTQSAINGFYLNHSLNEGIRKMGVLMTLGASLHMVQDFYSHSDWIHHDFVKLGFPIQKTPWGKERAPTWFEFAAKYPYPWTWPLTVSSGIYPPPGNAPKSSLGIPMTHTDYNHDNSQLFYDGASRVEFHEFGPISAQSSPSDHQLYSANTAAIASIEWVGKLEDDPITKAAIDFAKDWDLKKNNPAMQRDLSASLAATLLMSCIAKKWDGDNPPPQRAAECQAVTGSSSSNRGAMIAGSMMGGLPVAMISFTTEYWAMHYQHPILEQLVKGFGNEASGNYMFAAEPDMR